MVGDPQVTRIVVAAVRDSLRRGVEDELLPLPVGERAPRLHLRVVDERRGVAVLEDLVGGRESGLYITPAERHRAGLVLEVERKIALGPDPRCAVFQRFLGVEDEGQLLVVDPDEAERLLCRMAVDSGDGGDRLAHELDRIIEHVAAVDGDVL